MSQSNKTECSPSDIAVKSFFLGPQAENAEWLAQEWVEILYRWITFRKSLFPQDGNSISSDDQENEAFKSVQKRMSDSVHEILSRLEGEVPKFTPRYNGHMISEVSLPALLGHIATLLHNPNITTKESSKVVSQIETEAIADLCQMVGFSKEGVGHFTSGGTVANFEALWRARYHMDQNLALALYLIEKSISSSLDEIIYLSSEEFDLMLLKHQIKTEDLDGYSFLKVGPWAFQEIYQRIVGKSFLGPVVLVPGNKHFSWQKGVSFLGLGDEAFWNIELDDQGKLSIDDLNSKIQLAIGQSRPILMVVSVLGTTELGEVDPIFKAQELLENWKNERKIKIWHHVDGAYGAYYCTLVRGEQASSLISSFLAKDLMAVSKVDSLTIDPHKLGYVPYSCGAILIREKRNYKVSSFAAPYLSQEKDNIWAFTLEGSRSGAGAVSTWVSNRAIGLNQEGYGRLLEKGIQGRMELQKILKNEIPSALIVDPAELNILCLSFPKKFEKLSVVNQRVEALYKKFQQSPHFSASKTALSVKNYSKMIQRFCTENKIELDSESLFLLRLVIMNPFFVSQESKTHYAQELVNEIKSFLSEVL